MELVGLQLLYHPVSVVLSSLWTNKEVTLFQFCVTQNDEHVSCSTRSNNLIDFKGWHELQSKDHLNVVLRRLPYDFPILGMIPFN